MRRLLASILVLAGLSLAQAAHAGPLSTLDQFCGGALSSPGCVQTVAAFPLEVGAVVAIIEARPSTFSGAQDCKSKLGLGSPLFKEIAPYVSEAGGDVTQITDCACIIAYSTQTCSGQVEQIADDAASALSWALNKLDGLLGLDDTPTGPTLEQNLADYWTTVFKPVEPLMIAVSDDDVIRTRHQLRDKCEGEWFNTNEDQVAVCNGFMNRFIADITSLRSQYQAYQKGQAEVAEAKLQAQKDAIQAQKDALTDNARKVAMNWAQIKEHAYLPRCHDTICIEGVTVVAFAYYGQLASRMQALDSNTTALTQTNGQFEPIFKSEIAKDAQRIAARGSALSSTLAPRLARLAQVQAVQDEARVRLLRLGIRNPDLVLRRAYRLRAQRLPIRGLARQSLVQRNLR